MKNDYLDKISKTDLSEFMQICELLGIFFDHENFEKVVMDTLKYLNSSKEKRTELQPLQSLEKRWYNSLHKKSPDYTVYDDVYYLAETWVCWKKYSRQYIKSILSDKSFNLLSKNPIKKEIGHINTVVDLGCGIGYTSAALKQHFDCTVYATNLKDTKQWMICQHIAKQENFILKENFEGLHNVDLIFASEYFEHFEKPIEHLIYVMKRLNPKNIIFANTFNSKSIGHFDTYYHFGRKYTGKEISSMFSKTLKMFNMKKINTNIFNNRPNFYKKF